MRKDYTNRILKKSIFIELLGYLFRLDTYFSSIYFLKEDFLNSIFPKLYLYLASSLWKTAKSDIYLRFVLIFLE